MRRPVNGMSLDEPFEERGPRRIEALVRVSLGGRASRRAERLAQAGVVVERAEPRPRVASTSSTSTSRPLLPSLDDAPAPARRASRRAARPAASDSSTRLRAPLLTRGDDVRVERVVRAWPSSPRALRHDVPIRDPAPLELAADVAAGRPREKHVSSGISAATRSRAATRTSGPLTSFGSSPSPQPTPSFWNEPTTKASAGRPSAARAARAVLRRDEREVLDVDPDRDHVDTRSARRPPRARARRISAWVTWIREKRSRRRAERVVRTVELRVAGRPRPSVEIRRARAGASTRSSAAAAPRSGS